MGFSERGGWWLVPQVVVFGAIAGALVVWGRDWGPVARASGWALAVLGGLLASWGLVALGANLSPFPHPVEDGSLIDHGPYRLARHPVYGGLVMGSCGLGLIDGNITAIALAAALLAVFTGKAAFEESKLVAHLPGYAAYRGRVRRRMIPWLW